MVRFNKLYGSAALLIAAVGAFTLPARGQTIPTTIAGILCDTQDQIRSIVTANQKSPADGMDVYHQLNSQLNAKNMPTCAFQDVPHMLLSVPNSIDLGPWPDQGRVLEAFTLYLQSDPYDAWFMYLGPRSTANGV